MYACVCRPYVMVLCACTAEHQTFPSQHQLMSIFFQQPIDFTMKRLIEFQYYMPFTQKILYIPILIPLMFTSIKYNTALHCESCLCETEKNFGNSIFQVVSFCNQRVILVYNSIKNYIFILPCRFNVIYTAVVSCVFNFFFNNRREVWKFTYLEM